MSRRSTPFETFLQFALSLPEAYEDRPWDGDVVVKVNKKIFVFFGSPEDARVAVKLPESAQHALSMPGARPTAYGLGKSGWVTVPAPPDSSGGDLEVFLDWIEESYRTVAPKRLVKQLDEA